MHATRIATIALVAALAAPALASAGADRASVEGVVARVANEAPCAADRDGCSRQYVAFGGALTSTQPAWIELDYDAGTAGRVTGRIGFTGCIGTRCGTLRLVLYGRTSPGSSAPFSGTAVIRGAGGALSGLRGRIGVRPGSTARYGGTIVWPQPTR